METIIDVLYFSKRVEFIIKMNLKIVKIFTTLEK